MRSQESQDGQREKKQDWVWYGPGTRISLVRLMEESILNPEAGVVFVPEVPAGFQDGMEVTIDTGDGVRSGRGWLTEDGQAVRLEMIQKKPKKAKPLTQEQKDAMYFLDLRAKRDFTAEEAKAEFLAARKLRAKGFVDGAIVSSMYGGEFEIRWTEETQGESPGYSEIPYIRLKSVGTNLERQMWPSEFLENNFTIVRGPK